MAHTTQHSRTPHRHGTGWLVPSQSQPGTQYFVNADGTRCGCRGFSYRGVCAHLRVVIEASRLVEMMLDAPLYEGE
jgi:hypothetical protein